MNEKALVTLEYNKIIDMLASRAVSPMGKETAASLKPMTDLEDILLAQRETTEAAALILRKGTMPLGGIQDIRGSVARAAVGGVLSIEALLHVCDFLYVCRKIISYGHNDGKHEPLERIAPYFDGIGFYHRAGIRGSAAVLVIFRCLSA